MAARGAFRCGCRVLFVERAGFARPLKPTAKGPLSQVARRRLANDAKGAGEGPPKPPAKPDPKPPSAAAPAEAAAEAAAPPPSAGGGGGGRATASLPEHLSGVSAMYTDMEQALMARMRTHNKGQFRVALLSTLLGVVWVTSVFGKEIRRFFGEQAGEVARETLRHQSLQVQTQELATAVVSTLLNDQNVLSAATAFLRQAAGDAETQAALLNLATHVLRHPDTLKEVSVLVKQVVAGLLKDPDTLEQVTELMLKAVKDERMVAAAGQLVVELTQDEEVYAAVTVLSSRVMAEASVQDKLSEVLAESSHAVLNDEGVLKHTKEFVGDVVADDAVQRTGGTALWNGVAYALRTRAVKIVGVGLALGSIAILGGKYGR